MIKMTAKKRRAELIEMVETLEAFLKEPERFFISFFGKTKEECISNYIYAIKSNIEKI